MATGAEFTLFSCRPHAYLEPPQPLSPAFFFTSSTALSTAFSASSLASSPAVSTTSSALSLTFSTAPPALSLVPLKPLSAAFSTAFSALPALSLSAAQPLADVALPGTVIPPAPIRLTIPRLARNFFRSFFSMFSSF